MGDISKMSMMSNVYDSAMEDSDLSMYYSFSATQNKTIEAENSHLHSTLEAVQLSPDIKTVIKKTCMSPLRTLSKNMPHLQGLQGFSSTPNSIRNKNADDGMNILETSNIEEFVANDKKPLNIIGETENENLFETKNKHTYLMAEILNKSNAFCETQSTTEAILNQQSTTGNQNPYTFEPSQSDPDSVITLHSDCSNTKETQDKKEVAHPVFSTMEKSEEGNAHTGSNECSEEKSPNDVSVTSSLPLNQESVSTVFDSPIIDANNKSHNNATIECIVLNSSNAMKSFAKAGNNFFDEPSNNRSMKLRSNELLGDKESENENILAMPNGPNIHSLLVQAQENCDVSPDSVTTMTPKRTSTSRALHSNIGKLKPQVKNSTSEAPVLKNSEERHKPGSITSTEKQGSFSQLRNVKVLESPGKIDKPNFNLDMSANTFNACAQFFESKNRKLAIKKSLHAHVEKNLKIRNTRRTLCVSNNSDKNEVTKTSAWQAELNRVCKDIKLAEKKIRTRGVTSVPIKSPVAQQVDKLPPRKSIIPKPHNPASKTPFSSPRRASLKILKGMDCQKVETSKQSARRTLLVPSVSRALRNAAAVNSPSRRNVRRSVAPLAGIKPVLAKARKSLYRENGTTKPGVLAATKPKIISMKTTLNSPKGVDIKRKILRRTIVQAATVDSTQKKLQRPLRKDLYKPTANIKLIQGEEVPGNDSLNEKLEKVILSDRKSEKKVRSFNNPLPRTTVETTENKLRSLIAGTALQSEMTAAKLERLVATENLRVNRNVPKPKPEKGVFTKEENKCKFCDKKFFLKYALDNHLENNCSRIPSAELRKILETKSEAKSSVEIQSQKPSTPSTKGSSSCTKKVQRILRVPHSGVYKTPNKMITCYSCKINFKNVVDFSEHMLSHSPKSA